MIGSPFYGIRNGEEEAHMRRIVERCVGTAVLLDVEGDLDLEFLKEAADKLLSGNRLRLVVNLAKVKSLTVDEVGFLESLVRRAEKRYEAQGCIKFLTPDPDHTPRKWSVGAVIRLNADLDCFDNEDEAVASFGP